jgi:hypothetical protein
MLCCKPTENVHIVTYFGKSSVLGGSALPSGVQQVVKECMAHRLEQGGTFDLAFSECQSASACLQSDALYHLSSFFSLGMQCTGA